MTSVLTPVLSESSPLFSAGDAADSLGFQKQDTREYLADMLKELSAIAAWAELHRAQEHIDAALQEIEQEADKE